MSIVLKDVNLHYSFSPRTERSLKSWLVGLLPSHHVRPPFDTIHAIKDVSIQIQNGERVGILGDNGAGKSTFLKMLAGLYPISSGTRMVNGKVRALFDLNLGFEPDASGRENILYRGLLLGLTPKFIRSIESDIIAFADLGLSIDYPIKTYSTGMQMRLAFAISTAIPGDILLVDEIIGAGDFSFMAKAQQKINHLIEHAEILVLASHDFNTLHSLCTRGLVFQHGRIIFDGTIVDAIKTYQNIDRSST